MNKLNSSAWLLGGLLVLPLVSGCGNRGPVRHEITGTVTIRARHAAILCSVRLSTGATLIEARMEGVAPGQDASGVFRARGESRTIAPDSRNGPARLVPQPT